MNGDIFKSYDIRGIYPAQINEQNITTIIHAIGSFFRTKLIKAPITVAVGRDMRLSSPELTRIAIETLQNAGFDVVDLGLVSTPTFYFAVYHNGYDAGIQITASHNPKEYNGVKIVMKGKKGLLKVGKPTGMEDIKKMALQGITLEKTTPGLLTQEFGLVDQEVEYGLSLMDHPEIKKFKIVADPANAMGILYIDALFKKIPVDLIKMNFELDGTFPAHQPDPLQAENLVDLQKKVLAEKADIGLAPDGDGDRLFFVDETGAIVPPTIITSLVARELLQKYKGDTILFDIRYTITPTKIVAENGGKSVVTKVGHAFITEKLNETGGVFAGESSAHYYFRDYGNCESQIQVLITLLSVMTREKKKLSELVLELQRSFESGEFNFKVTNAKEIMEQVKEKYKDGTLDTLDGIAISYPTWRFSIRTSNTEPLLRLNLESLDKKTMEQKRDEIIAFIKSHAKE